MRFCLTVVSPYNWAVGEWLTEPRWNRVKGMMAPWGAKISQNTAKYAIIDFGQPAEG